MKSRIFIILLFLLLLATQVNAQTWQETLDAQFDVVSTFDDLQDWHGTVGRKHYSSIDIQHHPDIFPKKLDGSSSIWQFYSAYASEGRDWIADHGAENVWQGTGKSMIIDYGESKDRIRRGPSRMAFKIGDSPDDGYQDEVHVFYMTKWLKEASKNNFP